MLKYTVVRTPNTIRYLRHNWIHRKVLPAMVWYDGELHFMEYGDFHRENGPAIVNQHGSNTYWKRGKLQC
jgi:hypothetical protein